MSLVPFAADDDPVTKTAFYSGQLYDHGGLGHTVKYGAAMFLITTPPNQINPMGVNIFLSPPQVNHYIKNMKLSNTKVKKANANPEKSSLEILFDSKESQELSRTEIDVFMSTFKFVGFYVDYDQKKLTVQTSGQFNIIDYWGSYEKNNIDMSAGKILTFEVSKNSDGILQLKPSNIKQRTYDGDGSIIPVAAISIHNHIQKNNGPDLMVYDQSKLSTSKLAYSNSQSVFCRCMVTKPFPRYRQ